MINPLDIKKLPREVADALQLSQDQFESRRQQVIDRADKLDKETQQRYRVALVLKSLVVVCGVVLATGFLTGWIIQALGAIVLLITSLEYVFANYDNLISITAARDALMRIRRQAENIHEEHAVRIVSIRDSRPTEAAEMLIKLTEGLRKDLADKINEAERALEAKNYG